MIVFQHTSIHVCNGAVDNRLHPSKLIPVYMNQLFALNQITQGYSI